MHESFSFAFAEVSLLEVRDEINSLNTNKSNVANSITSKQLQDHIDICRHFLHDIINFCITMTYLLLNYMPMGSVKEKILLH